jgi:hypothetical protein
LAGAGLPVWRTRFDHFTTVDLGSFGPVLRSATAVRFFHLATVLGLMP